MHTTIRSLAVAGVLALSTTNAFADTFRLSHSYEPTTAHGRWANWIAQEVEARSDGRHTVDVFPSGQLGSERDVEEGLNLGTVNIAFVGPGHMAQRYKPIQIHLAAFLWRDLDHFLMYPKSKTYAEVTQGYEEASGNKVVALTYFGQRHATANRPVLTPAEFKGLKMRVPPVPIYMVFPKAVKANATPIDFSELYLALQQGTVDAQENPLPTIRGKKLYEVQSDIMLTGHITDGYFTLVSGITWNGLSTEDQQMLSEILTEAAQGASADIIKEEAELADWFTSQGVNVHKVDRQAFLDIVKPAIMTDEWPWRKDQIEELLDLGR
jgi:tripartite ATP-independent transporter DctP family solute receptor